MGLGRSLGRTGGVFARNLGNLIRPARRNWGSTKTPAPKPSSTPKPPAPKPPPKPPTPKPPTPKPPPKSPPRPPRKPATFGQATSTNYRKTFRDANPKAGDVVVHHAVEQQVKRRYPGVVSDAEMHSLENLRGIPKGSINNRIHLSAIRREWNEFYRNNPNATKQDLLDKATEIDDKYGHLFDPPVR